MFHWKSDGYREGDGYRVPAGYRVQHMSKAVIGCFCKPRTMLNLQTEKSCAILVLYVQVILYIIDCGSKTYSMTCLGAITEAQQNEQSYLHLSPPSLPVKRTKVCTSGFKPSDQGVYKQRFDASSVIFAKNPSPPQKKKQNKRKTNFVRFTGLLRTFADGPLSVIFPSQNLR